MADDDSIIIKKIKKSGGGHHGGAWKVAYADFVTAMMAFFLLLWLLSSASEEQKMGIAEYFTPTTGITGGMGTGTKGGQSAAPEGSKKSDLTDPGIVVGRLPQGPDSADPSKKISEVAVDNNTGKQVVSASLDETAEEENPDDSDPKASQEDSAEFKRIEEEMMNAIASSPKLKDMQDNVVITHTPEGLKIDIVDDQDRAMFGDTDANMTQSGEEVMQAIIGVIANTNNKISLSGHTNAKPFYGANGDTNWELSADRANASRRFITKSGISSNRIAKVEGFAGEQLLVPGEPNSPRNRRISLVLMRGQHIKSAPKPASRGLLSVPDFAHPEPVQETIPIAPTEPSDSHAPIELPIP